MKNKDLIKLLKKYPRDMNICLATNRDSNYYTFIEELLPMGNDLYIVGPNVKDAYHEEERVRREFERDNFQIGKIYIKKSEGIEEKPLTRRLENMVKLTNHCDGRFKGLTAEGNEVSCAYSFYELANDLDSQVLDYILASLGH